MISKYTLLTGFIILILPIQNENRGAVSGAYYRYYSYRSYYYYSYRSYYYGSYYYRSYSYITGRSSRAYSLARLGPYYNYYYNLYFKASDGRSTEYGKSNGDCLNLEENNNGSFLGYFSCPLKSVDPSNHTSCCGDSLANYCCYYEKPPFTGGEIAGIVIGAIIGLALLIGLCFWIYSCYKAQSKVGPSHQNRNIDSSTTVAQINRSYMGSRVVTGPTHFEPINYSQPPPPYPASNAFTQPPGYNMYPPAAPGVSADPETVNVAYPPPGASADPATGNVVYPPPGGDPAYPPSAPPPYWPTSNMPAVDVNGGPPPNRG